MRKMRFQPFLVLFVQLAAWCHTDTDTRKHCNTVASRLPGQVCCVDCWPRRKNAFNSDQQENVFLVLPSLKKDSGSDFLRKARLSRA